MKYKGVIFDLDGTLLDTLGDILVAVNTMLSENNFNNVTYDELKSMIGDGARKMIERALGKNVADIDSCLERYNQIYEKTTEYTKPFSDIPKLLDYLQEKKIKIAILSNKPQKDAEAIVKRVLPQYSFTAVIGQSDAYPAKPDTKGLLKIVEDFNFKIGKCLYIGDGEMDYITPNKVEMRSLSALWGYRTKEQLEKVGAREFLHCPNCAFKYL